MGEVRNATVHAFSVLVLLPRESGYVGYWGIYVREGGLLTRGYMALIAPFRRFLVYPAILNYVSRAWSRKYPESGG